jgi:hypothetical protein
MKLYSLSQAALKTGYASGDSLRTQIFRGQLKATKMGRDWFLTEKQVNSLNRNRGGVDER